jgi:hypothetical protein
MNLIKTVKRWVAGGDKLFDIYECTVDEVEEFTSDSNKTMTRIKVGDKTFEGLYNKWVYEHLCENEGTPSFVVLWRSKGKPFVAYVKEIWQDHLKGEYHTEVPTTSDNSGSGSSEAFVYCWISKSTDRKYIGTHKGTTDDGYIGSGEEFLKAYNEFPQDFKRTILAYGSQQEMYELETQLLLLLKAVNSDMYLNLTANLRK